MRRHHFSLGKAIRVSAILTFTVSGAGRAAPDDFDEQPTTQPAQNFQVNVMNINVDQQIFQTQTSEQFARDELKSNLQLQIESIDLLCHLNESQKQKLLLAAKGDMTRFFSAVSELRQKYTQVKNDGNVWNEFWQRVQPLQMKYNLGLFQENSLFEKTLHSTLNEEQLKAYTDFSKERSKRLFRTQCELAAVEFERTFPLRFEQHQKLVDLLVQEQQRHSNPAEFPQLFWILRIPEAKLRPVFDDWQWKKLEPQFRQFNPRAIINNRNIFNLRLLGR